MNRSPSSRPALRRTPPGSRPTDSGRRRTITSAIPVIATLVVLLACLIPSASADEILYDEDLVHYVDTSVGGSATFNGGNVQGRDTKYLHFNAIENYPVLSYIIADMGGNRFPSLESGENSFTYVLNGSTFTGTVYKSQYTNLLGDVTATRLIMFFDDWDIRGLSGPIDVSLSFGSGSVDSKTLTSATSPIYIKSSSGSYGPAFVIQYTIASSIPWKNHITIIEESQPHAYFITLERTILGDPYSSLINMSLGDEVVFTNYGHGTEVSNWFPYGSIDNVKVTDPSGLTYNYDLTGEEPSTSENPVTVYVRNSQTGALIANSHILINASVNGEFFEVINQTLSGGMYQGTLWPTGGGLPNPDSYRLVVSADGYVPVMPHLDFEHGPGPTTLIMEMDPTGGGPTDPDKTYVDIYVRDIYANPIPGATVNFGGYILTTNSAGYGVLDVLKNATYKYTVSKSGYTTIEGPVTLGDDPRHTINVVLGPGEVPTYTPTPTAPGATPTPDTRSPVEKAAAGLDALLDNAETYGYLAAMILLTYMAFWIVPKK